MSDRTHPTSFQARPPSPSSPAAESQKENLRLPIFSDHIPQTPTSPPLMSVSDQSHASDFTSSHTSSNQATAQPPNISSPPSSAPMSTQASQQPTMSTSTSFPTPASSVSGQPVNATSVGDTENGRKPENTETQGSAEKSGPGPDQQSSEHIHTNHNRQISQPNGNSDLATEKGRTSGDPDAMDVDTDPTRRVDPSNLCLESLQKELTAAFHLCKSSPIVTGPDPSVDLVSLYGLGSVAHSVARMDPVTGEKINRLRKSYEGKLKGLGLAGRNKSTKQEISQPGSLRYLTMWPEEEWQNQKVHGKPIKVSDMDSALQDLQVKAMQMEPGPVRNNDFWEDVLGHEKPAKHPAPGETGKKAAPVASGGRPTGQSYAASQSQEAERPRASRGRKRHYDDNSFSGYGEGYVDDDDDPGFYSNGEGSGKKKRKKDHVAKVSTPMSERSGSYGVGMFGIGAR